MTIGSRLRDERTRLRLSQTDLAVAVGIAKNTQLGYEKGERNPDASYLIAVASLGIDVNFVLFGTPTPTTVDSLNSDEAELLRHFRGMSDTSKDAARRMAFALAAADGALDSGKA
ncbi:helix-turn-helix domain-containing protein [Pseudomonas sp. HR1]|uniref:Helix-turn-helix domain-containing protein n=1 Tax=Pseudomonas benzopyrenica TaxID=2993566 RepID=A0ABZ2FVE2_9PSED|nr:helix-turn-helix domain-containing protein [Pseudomonas sp. HR1]MDK4198622.1 helix-turn-helix domain-containing protein [Pseudomonas sp. HR1]